LPATRRNSSLHAAGRAARHGHLIRCASTPRAWRHLRPHAVLRQSVLRPRLAGHFTDIAFYIQNVRSSDLTLVSAGRDIIAYNANSPLRTARPWPRAIFPPPASVQKDGDIQINGPGTLQVLAGRDLDLGTGANNSDGTGTGINSIGNGRNPFLPFRGRGHRAGGGPGWRGHGARRRVGSDFTSFLNTDFGSSTRHLSGPRGVARRAFRGPQRSLALTSEQQKQLALGSLLPVCPAQCRS
jgi:hypothetical protein